MNRSRESASHSLSTNTINSVGYKMITLLITIVLKIKTLLLNESIKRISISISNNSSIILELCNSFTPIKLSPFIWIPSSVSDGMSNSDSIINHYSPISLCLYPGNSGLLLWIEIEKEDLINQYNIIHTLHLKHSWFKSTVSTSYSTASKSDGSKSSQISSSFIRSFLLSNTIELQDQNAEYPISRVVREGRFVSSNDLLLLPTHPWITMDLILVEICSIWSIFDIQNTDWWRDNKWSEGVT